MHPSSPVPGARAALLGGIVFAALTLPALSAPNETEPGWSSNECMDCHPGQARRWSSSRHAQSFDNPNFATAWREARHRGWCLTCHQPEGEPAVTCTSCHRDHDAPTESVCESCHEFAGPRTHGPLVIGGDLLQSTVTEWKQSPAARGGRTCADCHLEGHRFPGAHDADQVRSALIVSADAEALVLQTTEALGHRLPTGDPFRRLEIELCADARCTEVLGSRTLGIVHTADDDGWLRVTSDTRLGPPGGNGPDAARVLRVDGARFWRVRLGLADPMLHDLPETERYRLVASGEFP